jgi:hypothetical protein
VDFAAGSQCAGVLASSRFEKSGIIYYIALLKLSSGNQLATITSVSPTGEIHVEKELAERINRANATKDIKSVKAALTSAVH